MENDLALNQTQADQLRNRVQELESQLAEARSALQALTAAEPRPQEHREHDERWRQALFAAPYPIMIRRDDGQVLMINAAWTEITGYTLQDIPTVDDWSRKAYGKRAPEWKSTILNEGFAQPGVKNWGEIEVQTRSGASRIWDFTTTPLGADEQGRQLVMVMVVDVTERRQAEIARDESDRQQQEIARLLDLDRARLSIILEHLPVGVWIADEEGRVIGKNKQADRIWAGDAPLLDSIADYHKYQSWIPGSDKPLEPDEYAIVRALRSGQPVEPVEQNIRRFDGSMGTVLVSAVPIKDNQGRITGVVAINVDITFRKRVEQALRDSEERFSKAFRKAPFAMILTHWKDGVILDINDAWLKLLGWRREEVLGKTTADFPFYARPEERPQVRKRIMNEESMSDLELQLVRKDHTYRTVMVSTTIIEVQGERCILGVLYDITDRSQAEDALRESEQRYRGLFEAMQQGLVAAEVVTDAHGNPVDYRYLDVNPAIERQYGIRREQFIGRTYTEVLPEGDREWISILGQVALTGEPTSVERFGRASRRWFEAHAYSPRPGQFINILTDITDRKQAEDALRLNETKYRNLVETAFEGVWMVDTTGRTTFVNRRMAEMLKYDSPDDLMDRSAFDFIPPEDIEANKARFTARLQTNSAVQYDVRLRCRDGSILWTSVGSNNVRDENGNVIGRMALFMDITERKVAEEALRKSEERFAKAFHSSPNAVIISRLSDGLIIEVNEGWRRIFGHTPDEVLGRKSVDLNVFVDPADRDKAIAQMRKEGVLRDYELQIRRKSGEIRDAVMSVEQIEINDAACLLTVMQDITERKRAEKALRESEQRFRSLADSMPQLVWTALPDGTVDYYNKRYAEYSDIKQVEGEAWEWAPVLHTEDVAATVAAWQRSVQTGEVYQAEHRVRMADGSYRWHLSRGIPMLDEQGRVMRWFGTATDIHAQKVAQEKLKGYAERLERSNRELEQFAFIASHDLQEPLRKVQMFGDLLLERTKTMDVNEREYVERMRGAAGRMREMVDGLLQLSRVNTQSQPFTQMELSRVTAEVLYDLTEQIHRSGGSVEVAALPTITGDPLQIRQLMQNLIGNALKYYQPGSAPRVKIDARRSANFVQIFVRDNGIGFDQEHAERIFQPFQRLVGRSEYEGSGMGLAICRKIVERHGGAIGVQSKPGEGTTFVVTLPLGSPGDVEKEGQI